MLLLIHQPLMKVALKMKTFSFNTMMEFTQEEPLQHIFRINILGHKLFHVFSIVRMQQRKEISRDVTKASALHGEFLMMICRDLFVNSKSLQILFIPSLITNEGDQQIVIHVAIHENACFSKRAAVTLLISPTCSLAV